MKKNKRYSVFVCLLVVIGMSVCLRAETDADLVMAVVRKQCAMVQKAGGVAKLDSELARAMAEYMLELDRNFSGQIRQDYTGVASIPFIGEMHSSLRHYLGLSTYKPMINDAPPGYIIWKEIEVNSEFRAKGLEQRLIWLHYLARKAPTANDCFYFKPLISDLTTSRYLPQIPSACLVDLVLIKYRFIGQGVSADDEVKSTFKYLPRLDLIADSLMDKHPGDVAKLIENILYRLALKGQATSGGSVPTESALSGGVTVDSSDAAQLACFVGMFNVKAFAYEGPDDASFGSTVRKLLFLLHRANYLEALDLNGVKDPSRNPTK